MKRTLLLLTAFGSGWCLSDCLLAQPPGEPAPIAASGVVRADDNHELLTRGPVHEAFAQAVTPTTEVGLVVKKEPPPMIDEIPPAQRPEGNDIAWIPGYWGWDDELNDYIWISGIWRAVPPGREWVPGYWANTTAGFQWVSGYWADVTVAELEYLPPPPENVDAGPTTQSPAGDEIWIPGTWVWLQNKYVWRAGYWAKGDPRWVWTNSHYVYTPRGYLYVRGYWDFLPQQRGVLFAPVYFNGPIARNYVYSPRLVVNTGLLFDHLFLRPTYRHYYYGDYYAAPYRGRGILPYFTFNNSRSGYDSLYSYQRWSHRNDRNWERDLESRYDRLRDREDGRPPRDYATWQQRNNREDRNLFFSGIQDYSRTAGSAWRFRDVGDDVRRDVGRMSRDLDTYRQQRIKAEAQAAARTGEGREPDRVRTLKPPIGDRATTQPGRDILPGRDVLPGRDDRPRIDRDDRRVPSRDEREDGPLGTPPNRETPKGEPRDLTPDSPKTPRVNPLTPVPRDTPRPDSPRNLRPETPKVETPKADPRPKLDPPKAAPMPMPRPEPRPEPRPSPQPQPRAERPERPSPQPGPSRPQGGGDRPNRGKKD